MPKAEIRNGKLMILLSDELREKLDVHDGGELEAHVLPGSVILVRRLSAIPFMISPRVTTLR